MNCKICKEIYEETIFDGGLCENCDNKYYWCEICYNHSKSILCCKDSLLTKNEKIFIFSLICCFIIYMLSAL